MGKCLLKSNLLEKVTLTLMSSYYLCELTFLRCLGPGVSAAAFGVADVASDGGTGEEVAVASGSLEPPRHRDMSTPVGC